MCTVVGGFLLTQGFKMSFVLIPLVVSPVFAPFIATELRSQSLEEKL
jgi:hypothetical protein